jgi:hypothetical protein
VIAGAGPRPGSADAAILRHVRAAVSLPWGSILHEHAVSTWADQRVDYELWQLTDPPHTYRVHKGPTEASFDGTTECLYDPSTNTIVERPETQSEYLPVSADTTKLLSLTAAHPDARITQQRAGQTDTGVTQTTGSGAGTKP